MSLIKQFPFDELRQEIHHFRPERRIGRVIKVVGLTLEVEGLQGSVGELCYIYSNSKAVPVEGEVVGFQGERLLIMVLGVLTGIGTQSTVLMTRKALAVKVGDFLLGTVLDGLGRSQIVTDEREGSYRAIEQMPPDPLSRRPITTVLETGVKAIDSLITVGEGQRLGIFAGSGVGKSTLLGMISQYAEADVNVICLIGERGREVKEFIERDLGEEGLKKSVIICATSDQPALVRIKSAYVATTIAEYFRDCGKKVMLMMDSVTRFAMAQREVGLSIGEPPTTRGYTPSVFSLLPRLMERSGMGETGSITAFYTVLVDGDDMNEPIADAVRGILDGHIVLSRKLATRNHFPAIDVNQSISRLMKGLVSEKHYLLASHIRNNLALYDKNEDLINIGAYVTGAHPQTDVAIQLNEPIQQFLRQSTDRHHSLAEDLEMIQSIISLNEEVKT